MANLILNIKPDWDETFFWKYLDLKPDFIDIKAYHIHKRKPTLYKKVSHEGNFNSYFNFKSKVILNYIMKDEFLDSLQPEDIIEDFLNLQPSLITTLDISIYQDDSLLEAKIKFGYFVVCLLKLKQVIPTKKIIVLIPARTSNEIRLCAKIAKSLGFFKMGLACADILDKEKGSISKIKTFTKIMKNYADEVFLFGISSFKYFEMLRHSDYIISSGWYHKVKLGKIYDELGAKKIKKIVINKNQQVFNTSMELTCLKEEEINLLKKKLRLKYFKNNLYHFYKKFERINKQTKLEEEKCLSLKFPKQEK